MEHKALLADAVREMRRLRSRVAELETIVNEPVAVIGMSCRFPGAAVDPDAFWQQLADGVDSVQPVSREGWDSDIYDPDPDAPNKLYSRAAGLLSTIDEFDPAFFGVSHIEAESMDPQQRLFL